MNELLVDTFASLLELARHPDTTNRQRQRAEYCTRVLAGNVDRLFVGTADGILVETLAAAPRVDVSGNSLHE